MKLTSSFALLATLFFLAPASRAQNATFWPDTIRPGVIDAEPLRRNLRALVATDVDRATLTLGLSVADNALRLSPDDPELLFLRARILYDLDRFEQSAEHLQRAIDINPTGPFALEAALVLGVALTRLDRFAEAAEAYRLFLEQAIWPRRRAIVLTNYGETQMAMGNLEAAASAFRRALAADERYSLAYFGLAVALDRLGEQGLALEEMRHGLSTGNGFSELSNPDVFYVPDWEIHYYRALAHEALGQTDRAYTQWQSFLTGGGSGGPYAELVRAHIERLE